MSHRHLAFLALALGVLYTVLARPARADDSEIFYSASSNSAGPNVMFIVDTSGSMSQTIPGATYTGSYGGGTYTGNCSATTVYFLSSSQDPAKYKCGEASDIVSTSLQCTKGSAALTSSGYYSDVFIQYRLASGTNYNWYTSLQSGSSYASDNVACKGDYPTSPASSAGNNNGYPASNSASANPTNAEWTTSTSAVYWSAETGTAYTAYLGNYLNYLQGGTTAAPYNSATNYVTANTGAGCSTTVIYFYGSATAPNGKLGCTIPTSNIKSTTIRARPARRITGAPMAWRR